MASEWNVTELYNDIKERLSPPKIWLPLPSPCPAYCPSTSPNHHPPSETSCHVPLQPPTDRNLVKFHKDFHRVQIGHVTSVLWLSCTANCHTCLIPLEKCSSPPSLFQPSSSSPHFPMCTNVSTLTTSGSLDDLPIKTAEVELAWQFLKVSLCSIKLKYCF